MGLDEQSRAIENSKKLENLDSLIREFFSMLTGIPLINFVIVVKTHHPGLVQDKPIVNYDRLLELEGTEMYLVQLLLLSGSQIEATRFMEFGASPFAGTSSY